MYALSNWANILAPSTLRLSHENFRLPRDLVLSLTPKGLNVPRVTKPVLVSVTSPNTIFRFFETFCEDASRNKLCVSINFMILGDTVQKLWVFEVFG
jgi:hypothetical protein